jgi:hypothetical protein
MQKYGMSRLQGLSKKARTTIDCVKSETKLSFPHEQFCASAWPRPRALLPAPLAAEEAPRKPFARSMPGNPLISLDSDERIQGNPRKSNSHESGSLRRNGQGPRKPKWIDRAALEKEPTDSIRRQSGLARRAPWMQRALVKGYSSSSPGSGLALAPGMT